jgi:hypothetical protein
MEDFSPLEQFERFLSHWWLVLVITLLGATGGYLFHLGRPPLYQAQASIVFGIDYTRTGYIPPFNQDQLILSSGQLISSTSVVEATLQQAAGQGIHIDPATFYSSINLERQGYLWLLGVRNRDPRTAATLANLWAEEAYHQLTAALGHAAAADNLTLTLQSLETCLERSVAVRPAYGDCNLQNTAVILAQIKQTGAAIAQEKVASRGLVSAITVDYSQQATIPARPTNYNLNLLVLGGALIGFLAGILATSVRWPARMARGRRGA